MESKISFNGKEYNSIEEMPAKDREVYEQLMKALDADGDGVPDLIQHGGMLGKLMYKGVSKLLARPGVGDLQIETHRSGKQVRLKVQRDGSGIATGDAENQQPSGAAAAQTMRPSDVNTYQFDLNKSQNLEGGFSPLFKILVLLGLGCGAYYLFF